MSTANPSDAAAPSPGLAQPILAGTLAAIVGYASTFTLVLAGLQATGASAAEAGSGLFVTCMAMVVLNGLTALRTRQPLTFAWSTPGAAFLVAAGTPAGGFPATVGALIVTGVLIVLAGLIKPLSRAIAAIPSPIANAMLAGILLTLCLAPVKAVEAMPLLALPVIGAWAISLRFARRYAVPVAVGVAAVLLVATSHFAPGTFAGGWPHLMPVMPVFTLDAILRLSVPLFIVTMASQNLPGIAVMQANGYNVNPAPHFISTGLLSAVGALAGGMTVNFAAITAAICAGPEAHPDPARRWVATLTAGALYVPLGLMASLAAAFIAASPPLLIEAVAGLALLSSLGSALSGAVAAEETRLPAVVTFVTAASGLSILGIGGAFWGLCAGIGLLLVLRRWRRG